MVDADIIAADIIALGQLVHRCAAAVDGCDEGAFLAAFTPGARLRSFHPGDEQPFADLAEHEQLATIPKAMRGIFRCTAHMISNHQVEVVGDSASGTLLCTARHLSIDAADPAALTVIIRYVDRYERQDAGWLIAEREIRFLWSERHEVVESAF